ncbi:MAG: P-II family nitrogen regulator [Lachnospiraceae bacterium]|nr:P-II family nitrogen regulator [Lachnospiraceae bacterium]
MKMVQVVLKPEKLEILKQALEENDAKGLNVTSIMGCGNQKGYIRMYRGVKQSVNILPKIKLDIVVADNEVEKVVDIVMDALADGSYGDGKIFIRSVEEVVRVRTGETGVGAL